MRQYFVRAFIIHLYMSIIEAMHYTVYHSLPSLYGLTPGFGFLETLEWDVCRCTVMVKDSTLLIPSIYFFVVLYNISQKVN